MFLAEIILFTGWLRIIQSQIIQPVIIYFMVFKICARLYTCTTFPLSENLLALKYTQLNIEFYILLHD